MTGPGPGAGSAGGDRNKRVDLGGADAVPDTSSTAKRQGAEPNAEDRRLTPRGTATEAAKGGGMKPIVLIIIAIAVIAVGYFVWGMR